MESTDQRHDCNVDGSDLDLMGLQSADNDAKRKDPWYEISWLYVAQSHLITTSLPLKKMKQNQ